MATVQLLSDCLSLPGVDNLGFRNPSAGAVNSGDTRWWVHLPGQVLISINGNNGVANGWNIYVVGLSTFWSQAMHLYSMERVRQTLIRPLPGQPYPTPPPLPPPCYPNPPYPRNVRNPLCVQWKVIEQVQVLGSGPDSGEDRRTAAHLTLKSAHLHWYLSRHVGKSLWQQSSVSFRRYKQYFIHDQILSCVMKVISYPVKYA